MKYSVEIANNINSFLEEINSEIYLSCIERKTRAGLAVAGSWKKRNISCDPKYPNIVDITETQVKNFLKKNYGVNLLTLIKSVAKAKEEYNAFFKKQEKQIIKTPIAADGLQVDSIESKLDTIIELLKDSNATASNKNSKLSGLWENETDDNLKKYYNEYRNAPYTKRELQMNERRASDNTLDEIERELMRRGISLINAMSYQSK